MAMGERNVLSLFDGASCGQVVSSKRKIKMKLSIFESVMMILASILLVASTVENNKYSKEIERLNNVIESNQPFKHKKVIRICKQQTWGTK